MDVIARLPGCAGQAADAVSVYTQVKIEDASASLKLPESECPEIWIRQPHKWPKSWSNIEVPVVPLERNLYGHPLVALLWERQFEKFYWDYHGWIRNLKFCPFLQRSQIHVSSGPPWNRRDRCVFRHRDADTDVKPPVTRTEEEIGVELAALWEAVSKLACSLLWRTGQLSTCSCRKSWRSPP